MEDDDGGVGSRTGSSGFSVEAPEFVPRTHLAVVDPFSRKLLIPTHAMLQTRAVLRAGTPSLCILFLNGRCRQGELCHQVHADLQVVEQLRQEAQALPTCCAKHSDPHAPRLEKVLLSISVPPPQELQIDSVSVPFNQVAYTHGLERHLAQFKQSLGDVALPNGIMKIDLPPQLLCRLHAMNRCRFCDDCKFVHICREEMVRHFPDVAEDRKFAAAAPSPHAAGSWGAGATRSGSLPGPARPPPPYSAAAGAVGRSPGPGTPSPPPAPLSGGSPANIIQIVGPPGGGAFSAIAAPAPQIITVQIPATTVATAPQTIQLVIPSPYQGQPPQTIHLQVPALPANSPARTVQVTVPPPPPPPAVVVHMPPADPVDGAAGSSSSFGSLSGGRAASDGGFVVSADPVVSYPGFGPLSLAAGAGASRASSGLRSPSTGSHTPGQPLLNLGSGSTSPSGAFAGMSGVAVPIGRSPTGAAPPGGFPVPVGPPRASKKAAGDDDDDEPGVDLAKLMAAIHSGRAE